MAKEDDNYKEGVDFEWVQGNNDENSGFKTRRFFTKAEKKARNAPKVEAPKAVKKKPKLKGITTEKITTTTLPSPAGPKPDLATLKREAEDQASISRVKRDVGETFAGKKYPAGSYKKGGMIKEGSAKDMREDKAMAKKAGMTMKQHEASAADKKHDAPKKMASGGKIKMVEKGGKKVPAFAADGVGKMAMGGAVKKMNYGGGMKTGGTVRGAGAAIRGKRFTGSC